MSRFSRHVVGQSLLLEPGADGRGKPMRLLNASRSLTQPNLCQPPEQLDSLDRFRNTRLASDGLFDFAPAKGAPTAGDSFQDRVTKKKSQELGDGLYGRALAKTASEPRTTIQSHAVGRLDLDIQKDVWSTTRGAASGTESQGDVRKASAALPLSRSNSRGELDYRSKMEPDCQTALSKPKGFSASRALKKAEVDAIRGARRNCVPPPASLQLGCGEAEGGDSQRGLRHAPKSWSSLPSWSANLRHDVVESHTDAMLPRMVSAACMGSNVKRAAPLPLSREMLEHSATSNVHQRDARTCGDVRPGSSGTSRSEVPTPARQPVRRRNQPPQDSCSVPKPPARLPLEPLPPVASPTCKLSSFGSKAPSLGITVGLFGLEELLGIEEAAQSSPSSGSAAAHPTHTPSTTFGESAFAASDIESMCQQVLDECDDSSSSGNQGEKAAEDAASQDVQASTVPMLEEGALTKTSHVKQHSVSKNEPVGCEQSQALELPASGESWCVVKATELTPLQDDKQSNMRVTETSTAGRKELGSTGSNHRSHSAAIVIQSTVRAWRARRICGDVKRQRRRQKQLEAEAMEAQAKEAQEKEVRELRRALVAAATEELGEKLICQAEKRQQCTRMLLGSLRKGFDVEDVTGSETASAANSQCCLNSTATVWPGMPASTSKTERKDVAPASCNAMQIVDLDDQASTVSSRNSDVENIDFDEGDGCGDKGVTRMEWNLCTRYVGNAICQGLSQLAD